MKTCNRCLKKKPLLEFNKAGNYYQSKCKPCQYIYKKEWQANNPKKNRLSRARQRMEISDTDFERVHAMKHCQICSVEHKSLHIDHNHKTGVIRGALCPNCNHGLGKFLDNKKILFSAIKYLTQYE